VRADVVVSTASTRETMLRLLGGRYLDGATRRRLERWPTFEPLVLFSAGVSMPLAGEPAALVLRQPEPLLVGGLPRDNLYLRIFGEDPAFAPPGHAVIQAHVTTDYRYWANLGDHYAGEKEETALALLGRIERRFPGLRARVEMVDLATPLTFWRWARAPGGAYEGWLPTARSLRSHLPRWVPGVAGLYLAGQWVEPGGGVPAVLASGRQLIQILAEQAGRRFHVRPIPPREPREPRAPAV
jgi:phytoene desaturase